MVDCVYSLISSTLFLLVVWFILFIIRKDTRKEMLFTSVSLTVLGWYASYTETFNCS